MEAGEGFRLSVFLQAMVLKLKNRVKLALILSGPSVVTRLGVSGAILERGEWLGSARVVQESQLLVFQCFVARDCCFTAVFTRRSSDPFGFDCRFQAVSSVLSRAPLAPLGTVLLLHGLRHL